MQNTQAELEYMATVERLLFEITESLRRIERNQPNPEDRRYA